MDASRKKRHVPILTASLEVPARKHSYSYVLEQGVDLFYRENASSTKEGCNFQK